jgi:tetratricopeptide (TPR) repeat protein
MSKDSIKVYDLKENHEPELIPASSTPDQTVWTRLGSTFAKIFAGLGGIWLILELVSYFLPEKPLAEYRIKGLAGVVTFGLFIGLAWELLVLHQDYVRTLRSLDNVSTQNTILKRNLVASGDHDAENSLIDLLRGAYSKRNWEEVITLGRALSRPLWLTGRYQLRIEIGKLVESAAAFSDKPEIQASALIDDLGWTSVALRRYEEAIQHIQHGLSVAQKANAYGLVCRAFRHLAGIYLKRNEIEQAEIYAKNAEDALKNVVDQRERDELIAGLAYQRARELQSKGDHASALTALISAQEMFARLADRDRAFKVYAPIGQVQLEMGDIAAAKDSFRRGLATARVSSRHDCELVNLKGLAEVALREESYAEAKEFLLEASATAAFLGDSYNATDLRQRVAKLSM